VKTLFLKYLLYDYLQTRHTSVIVLAKFPRAELCAQFVFVSRVIMKKTLGCRRTGCAGHGGGRVSRCCAEFRLPARIRLPLACTRNDVTTLVAEFQLPGCLFLYRCLIINIIISVFQKVLQKPITGIQDIMF